jgi:hypothetical protein
VKKCSVNYSDGKTAGCRNATDLADRWRESRSTRAGSGDDSQQADGKKATSLHQFNYPAADDCRTISRTQQRIQFLCRSSPPTDTFR